MLRIKVERLRRRWSQQDLAVHAGMYLTDICRIETRHFVPYRTQLERLARVLELKPEEVLEEVDEGEEQGKPSDVTN